MLTWLRESGFSVIPVIVPLVGEMPDDVAIRTVEALFSNVIVVDRGGEIRYALSDAPDVLSSLHGEYTPRYAAQLGEEHVLSGRDRELLIIDRLYCPDAAIATVQRLQSALGPHVFLAQYVWMTRVLPLIGEQAVKVLDTHDVFSTKGDKVLSFGIDDLSLSRGEEAKKLALADIVIAIEQDEHHLLQKLVPDTVVVTAGVDFDMAGTDGLPSYKANEI